MAIDNGKLTYFIHTDIFAFQKIGNTWQYDVYFEDLLDLDGANLIRSVEAIQINFSKGDNYEEGNYIYEEIEYAGKPAKIDHRGKQLNLIYFTQVGRELRKLIQIKENPVYTERLKFELGNSFIIE